MQRTPLARPRSWARSWGVVACRRSCRSVEVASGAAESWALGIRPHYHAIHGDRWHAARRIENTVTEVQKDTAYPIRKANEQPRWNVDTKGERKTCQHAEQRTDVERSAPRIKTRSARREENLRGKECATDKNPVSTPRKEFPWQGVRHGQKSTPQHAEKRTSVERSELRIKNLSARRAKNLRRKDCDKDKKPVSTPSKEPPWQGLS